MILCQMWLTMFKEVEMAPSGRRPGEGKGAFESAVTKACSIASLFCAKQLSGRDTNYCQHVIQLLF